MVSTTGPRRSRERRGSLPRLNLTCGKGHSRSLEIRANRARANAVVARHGEIRSRVAKAANVSTAPTPT